MPNCPACGTAHKSGSVFSSAIHPVFEHDERYQFIKSFWSKPEAIPYEFCDQCINTVVGQTRRSIENEGEEINKELLRAVNHVPVF